jgi:hypothetical protein
MMNDMPTYRRNETGTPGKMSTAGAGSQSSSPNQAPASLKGEAAAMGQQLKQQASDAAKAVKDQANDLAEGAKDMASQAGEKLRDTLTDQKAAGADFVSGIAGAVRRAAGEFDNDIPQAGQYIRRAAEQINGVADAMRRRDMNELMGEVQSFARRQPTAFLGASVLAGFALVRFLKSTASASGTQASGQSATGSRSSTGNTGQTAGSGHTWSGQGERMSSAETGTFRH